jgi:hypothetical protein
MAIKINIYQIKPYQLSKAFCYVVVGTSPIEISIRNIMLKCYKGKKPNDYTYVSSTDDRYVLSKKVNS